MTFVSRYLVNESNSKVCYETQDISHVIFLQYPQQNDGKKKTRRDKEVKTHYKNGGRGRIRKPSGTGTISSQHLAPEPCLSESMPAFDCCNLCVASCER
jgi:hypothetical protein